MKNNKSDRLSNIIKEHHDEEGIDLFSEMRRHCDDLIPIIHGLAYDDEHAEWWMASLEFIDNAVHPLHLHMTPHFFYEKFLYDDFTPILIGIGHAYRVSHKTIYSILTEDNIIPVLEEIQSLLDFVTINRNLKRQIIRDLEKIRDILRQNDTHSSQSFSAAYNKVSSALSDVVALQDAAIQEAVRKRFPMWKALSVFTFVATGTVSIVSDLTQIGSSYTGGYYDSVMEQAKNLSLSAPSNQKLITYDQKVEIKP